MNPFLGEAGVFQVLVEHRVANVDLEVQGAPHTHVPFSRNLQ